MGSFFSTSITHSADISESHVNLWIVSGMKFDMSLILNQTLQNMVEKLENIIIANNQAIITNILLILTIVILPIIFVFLRCHYQQFLPKINCNNDLTSNSVKYPMSHDKFVPKSVLNCVEGYLV